MKKNEKKMILILILLSVLIIGVIYLCTRPNKKDIVENNIKNEVKEEFVKVQDNGTKVNISNKLKEEKDLNGLKISNIELKEKDGQLRLLADISNKSKEDVKEAFYINIILIDKTGKEIDSIRALVTPIKVGETKKISAGITEDYANAYDFKVVKK